MMDGKMTYSAALTSTYGLLRTDVQEATLNARNIIGIVVFLIVVYLVLHFLFHVI